MTLSRVLAAATLLVVVGCRTVNDVLVDYRTNVSGGKYASAAAEPSELAAKENGDRLMWRLMAASAYDLAGDTDNALANFDVAEDIMIENDNASVFSQATDAAYAMMLNDKYFPYDGGGQDRIFTCLYKAIGYGTRGNFVSARTELNRAAQHQENWLWERKKDIDAADKRLAKEASEYSREKGGGHGSDEGQSNIAVQNAMKNGSFGNTVKEAFGFDIFTSGVLDKLKPADYQNPYVSHVCGVFRWLNGDGDGRGYFRDVLSLRPGNSVAKRDFEACDHGIKPANQVWVYVEDGLAPEREAWRIDLPLALIPYAGKYVAYAGLSLPRLLERPAAASSWAVGGERMQLLANVDALVKIEYDVYMRGALKREITRTVVDVGVQVALGVAAEEALRRHNKKKEGGLPTEYYALKASQLAVAGYSAARRGADTRCWPTLPKTVYVARVERPSDGKLSIRADGGNAVEVVLPEGNSMVFVRKPSAAAVPSVKVLTWSL
ncbi:MAG: hypothetical protein II840_14015 [Kiritimatiellae bacterium]|nr:hypothetical protein [Kiritimatiellia bacterium]